MLTAMNFRPLLFTALLGFAAQPASATWYSENVENGADVIMMDLRWPWWPSGTYFANWNSSFNPKPNNLSFYAGFTSYLADGPGQKPNPNTQFQDAFRPGSVWTFWGSNAEGTPVRFLDVAPNLYIKNDYGGEGSSGTTGAEVWPFVQRQRWYTMLARVWQPVEGGHHAYVARWIKDQAADAWHLIGMARLPIAAQSFTGNSGFLEPLTSEKAVRSLHRRLGYYRRDGQWKKSDTISIDKTQYVIVNTPTEGDHEYCAIEYAQRPDLLPRELHGVPLSREEKHFFTVKQPDLPTLDRPAVDNVKATALHGQVVVSWDVPLSASPAFSCKVEVFADVRCEGAPLAVREERQPMLRNMLVASPGHAAAVRLTLTDVFDQSVAPVVVVPTPASPAASAAAEARTRVGLAYVLYHQDEQRQVNYFNPPQQKPDERHYWLTLDELTRGKQVRRGLARGFDLSVKDGRRHGYGLTFTGLLRVPADGLYIFRTGIDGAYRLQLDDQDLLVRDGQFGTTEKAAVAALKKGEHRLQVFHVYDALAASNFRVDWEGPGFSREPIPLEALRVPDNGDYPSPVLQAKTPGDGTGIVEVQTEPNGHQISRLVLFLGTLQLAESSQSILNYHGPLPAGESSLWCRVIFDQDQTVDSPPVTVNVTGPPPSQDWTLRNVGDAKAHAGLWQKEPGHFQFFGSGMHTVTRRITGDFTATCRLQHYHGSHGEPVNPSAWTGLTAREHGERLNWEWGSDFHLVQSARNGLRASADFTDFGAGRVTSYQLPKDRPWLRIMRQGNIWTAWTSPDGAAWELGAYQFKRTQPDMDVGLFFSALPQDARTHYQAEVSDLAVEKGAAPGSAVPAPIPAQHTDGPRFTGVVMARADARIIVLRSSADGLRRSSDGGQTWAAANGNLTGADLAVRSVAIHPENPGTMLRAAGTGTESRLWKTEDAGKSWKQLPFPGDFDGGGPSALCGEVVAYDLRDPRILYAGCESRGFFKSTDGGTTWKLLGAAGERTTAVVVWPWEKHYPAPAHGKSHLCVTTCPDRWMSLLGRGEPAVKTAATTSRSYLSSDGVLTIQVSDERPDTGFLNVAFDKALQSVNEMRYATTHGYQTQIFAGSHMALYPPEKKLEWLRPFTAVAATALGEEKFGRFMTQALDPATPGRYSVSERWAFEFSWLQPKGDLPKGGLIAAAGDVFLGRQWAFLHTDGLFVSSDGGATLTKVTSVLGPVQ